jgi:hypothetical protein
MKPSYVYATKLVYPNHTSIFSVSTTPEIATLRANSARRTFLDVTSVEIVRYRLWAEDDVEWLNKLETENRVS